MRALLGLIFLAVLLVAISAIAQERIELHGTIRASEDLARVPGPLVMEIDGHRYTSMAPVGATPGREFRVKWVLPPDVKDGTASVYFQDADALTDLAGWTSSEITAGTEIEIKIAPRAEVQFNGYRLRFGDVVVWIPAKGK